MTIECKKKFANVGVLKQFTPQHLALLLTRFQSYLDARGVRLPAEPDKDSMPYPQIVDLCMRPGPDTPEEFLDALHLISTMGTDKGRSMVEDEARHRKIALKAPGDLTNPDFALVVYLEHRNLLEETQARAAMERKRAFSYYPLRLGNDIPALDEVRQESLDRLARSLDAWYANRGYAPPCSSSSPLTTILPYDETDEVWLLIRRSSRRHRQPVLDETHGSSALTFRPEEYDALVFNRMFGEIKIAAPPKFHEVYREYFGSVFFNDPIQFVARDVFALGALLSCTAARFQRNDVVGIVRAEMRGIEYSVMSSAGRRMSERSDAGDILADRRAHETVAPSDAVNVDELRMHFHFRAGGNGRTVVIRNGNTLNYSREADSAAVEQWLQLRQIMLSRRESSHAAA